MTERHYGGPVTDDATDQQIETMIMVHQCELRQIDMLIPTLLQPELVSMYSKRQRFLQVAVGDLQRRLVVRRGRS
jgi:hypothetical protein